MAIKALCVFCGSSPGRDPVYAAAAAEFGIKMVEAGYHLVYGGGRVGLMGVVADSVMRAGGEVVGVIPHFLNSKEIGHDGVTRLEAVDTMHERKARMEKLSDAFVALPGGFGTYEEILEIITWGQLGLHRKPIGLLNLKGYYQPLLAQVDRGVEEGFIKPSYRQLLVSADKPTALLEALASYEPPEVEQWLAAGET
ncbi:MAG: TIGR00730 family Rossman fold protein [Candidatus Eremiobacteraeota bacterium]|nr:TIGR00730 family Rossman fold protein [Candidatus Eremiobacteraeota bacterium]